jgi:hypothetical protein
MIEESFLIAQVMVTALYVVFVSQGDQLLGTFLCHVVKLGIDVVGCGLPTNKLALIPKALDQIKMLFAGSTIILHSCTTVYYIYLEHSKFFFQQSAGNIEAR